MTPGRPWLSASRTALTTPERLFARLSRESQRCLLSQGQNGRGSDEGSMTIDKPRIHILGLGNVGKLFAFALAAKPDPTPVTLLFHRQGLVRDWDAAGRAIEIVTDSRPCRQGQYETELMPSRCNGYPAEEMIKHLIVATKAAKTTAALEAVKHRLDSDSTVLFAQNGMGTVEEVTKTIFPDVRSRPQYLSSVNYHANFTAGPFSTVRANIGKLALAVLPRDEEAIHETAEKTETPFIIQEMLSADHLRAFHVDTAELLCLQLEKLAVNGMINPLTVIFDCKNGELFNRDPIRRLMMALLREFHAVIQTLPGLEDMVPDMQQRLELNTLQNLVLHMAENTASNTSSMLQDVQAGRETEVDYINGWILGKASERTSCPLNEKLVQLVKDQVVIAEDDIPSHFQGQKGRSWASKISGMLGKKS